MTAMRETPYAAEDILQKLLEDYPDLLAGGQMTPGDPRRWLLVRREQGVPDRADSAGRWSVDHLFVDHDAVPTLVEVKRSSDTRIRREVVGQMLDYAANGVRYWPIADLRAAFVQTQEELGTDADAEVQILMGDQAATVDEFFARVESNLKAGRIRMVFVADIVPDELMRIVEFLNEQMSPAEVFAVEVKQYAADGYPGRVIVPAVHGRTAAASAKSPASPVRDRATALAQSARETLELLSTLERWASQRRLQMQEVSSGALIKSHGRSVANVYLAPDNGLEFPIQALRNRGHEVAAEEILLRLRELTKKSLTSKAPILPSEDAIASIDVVLRLLEQIESLQST